MLGPAPRESPRPAPPYSRLGCLVALLLALSGCANYSSTLWRPGAAPLTQLEPSAGISDPGEIEIYYKPEFARFEKTSLQRRFMCGTTTVLRKAFLLPEASSRTPPLRFKPLAHITTEEFPRDEKTSRILGERLSSVLGSGPDNPCDLFEISLDSSFREEALDRLRFFAAELGADAIVDVFATGEAEHHMWHGEIFSLDPQSTRSLIYVDLKLLDLQLRDVRLHGTAVIYE